MKKWKDIILHNVPVAILVIGAIFGLTAEEQSTLAQLGTALVSAAFGVLVIVMHHKKKKAR